MAYLRPIPTTPALPPLASAVGPIGAGEARPWPAALGRWLTRLRERDELAGLTARERRDAGITAYDVAFETRKHPWRD